MIIRDGTINPSPPNYDNLDRCGTENASQKMKIFNLGNKDVPGKAEPRSGDRRSGENSAYEGEERRQETDRRGLLVGLKFKTGKPIGPIEDWLQTNFSDTHHFAIESMSEDLYIKEIKVVFATVEQRDEFKVFLAEYVSS